MNVSICLYFYDVLYLGRNLLIIGMILWVMYRNPRMGEDLAIAEVQEMAQEHPSFNKYAIFLRKNHPWPAKWVHQQITVLKQQTKVELRKKFYGYPIIPAWPTHAPRQ